MESAVADTAGNKLVSDKNTLLAVLQLLRKYNLKVEYILGHETYSKLAQNGMISQEVKLHYDEPTISCVIVDGHGGRDRVDTGASLDVRTRIQMSATTCSQIMTVPYAQCPTCLAALVTETGKEG
jgi:hypothetical protein